MKYSRLCNRMNELIDMYDKTEDNKFMNEHYSIVSIFECETLKLYEKILEFAQKYNFNNVYDIGCAFAHQSEVFLKSGVDYIGINDHELNFWNNDTYNYIVNQYPFKIVATDNDLAISVLCLTWNCYLYEKEKTLKEQCEALQRDFKHCLLYISNDKVDFVKKYFNHMEVIDEQLYYFHN